MAAPVVPIHEASNVPMMSIVTFKIGVPRNRPRNKIPPETVYKDHSRIIKGT